MTDSEFCTAFTGDRRLAMRRPPEAAMAVGRALNQGQTRQILTFDNCVRQIDFDLRGAEDEIAARLRAPESAQGSRLPGRPKLGVVAREVTLLPRHWDWLSRQRGGASAALRRRDDSASRVGERPSIRDAQQSADRFMSVMLGNQPGYEEAARALYARECARFMDLTEAWPKDLRDHARHLAAPTFEGARAPRDDRTHYGPNSGGEPTDAPSK